MKLRLNKVFYKADNTEIVAEIEHMYPEGILQGNQYEMVRYTLVPQKVLEKAIANGKNANDWGDAEVCSVCTTLLGLTVELPVNNVPIEE